MVKEEGRGGRYEEILNRVAFRSKWFNRCGKHNMNKDQERYKRERLGI
jgi:hypothetical protein